MWMSDGTRRLTPLALVVGLAALLGTITVGMAQTPTDLGRRATPAEVEAWGSIIGPDGDGLPPGRATAAEGKDVYRRRCARCHGMNGNEGPDDRLVGGVGTLASDQPRKTVGSYWPVATTLWDYVNRAMPFDQPGFLTSDEVYATVAYVLFLNEIIGEREPMDASSLPLVRMPNRDGFVPDPRPDIDGGSTQPR
jgi:cytochrome c